MHIAIIIGRSILNKWGGDYQVLRLLEQSFLESKSQHTIKIYPSPAHISFADIAFIAGTKDYFGPFLKQLKMRNILVGFIPFYEDTFIFQETMLGFLEFYIRAVRVGEESVLKLVDQIWDRPEIISLGTLPVPSQIERCDYYSLLEVDRMIASSNLEITSIKKIFPDVKASVVHWQINSPNCNAKVGGEFLDLVGLKSKEYILQVGRFESRKNQLATITACKDLDIPLVFIATQGGANIYENLCIKLAKILRKAPTYFVGGNFNTNHSGFITSINYPSGILPYSTVLSAFKHAKLHVMPSFFELPGLVHFEAMQQGVHSIVGKWGAWEEYLTYGGFPLKEGLKYMTPVTPHHIKELKEAITNALDIDVPCSSKVPILNRDFKSLANDFSAICEEALSS